MADAGVDADAPEDAPEDVPEDVPEDAPEDVPEDVPNPCTPEVTNIYVVTAESQLFAFLPDSGPGGGGKFEARGNIACQGNVSTPFSMAVSRQGDAYVVMSDGTLWNVSVFDATCEPTPYEPAQLGWQYFGMGYAKNVDDDDETLYVAEISFNGPPKGLGYIDTDTFLLHPIAPFSQNFGNALELTPAGDGPLWGYWLTGDPNGGGVLTRINTESAVIEEQIMLNVGPSSSALAVAWWGGSFYIFTVGPDGGTTATRYNPDTKGISVAGKLSQTVVGAGVSTCAPTTQGTGGAGSN